MASDIIQRTREGVVAVVDAFAGITAITKRAKGNVLPWGDPASDLSVYLRYSVGDAALTGIAPGEFWKPAVGIAAFATDEATCHALLEQVQLALTAKRLAELAVPLDAHVNSTARTDAEFDRSVDLWKADIRFRITVKK